MPKDLQELHECIAMSLPRLQLAFIHLPENDSDRSKFMVGLECEMVQVDEPTSWCQGLKVIQNKIYVLYGATCQWDSPVAVHPGVLMCSCYIQSFHFANQDTATLTQFAEEFISTYPPPSEIHNYQFENQWWTILTQVTFPSPMVCLFQ